MSPTSPTRPKRRRTTLTQSSDVLPANEPVDHQPTEASSPGGPSGYTVAQTVTAGEPSRRKRQEQMVGSKHYSAIPMFTCFHQGPGGMQLIPTTVAAGNVRMGTGLHTGQHQTTEMMPVVYHHRPTYRADLAKRGYLVRNSLGCGSYSKVKKALNSRRNFELTAVKIVDRLRAPRDYQEKFMPRELALWPALSHPNLIRFIDYFEENSRVYMVLEFAEGGDALHYVQTTGALHEEQAKTWTSQIVSAVAYMHELGIAHRDLKLENLLLSRDLMTIKICDFGFVRQIQPADSDDLSRTFCGSKAYAAPEILQGRPYDPMKADVWAVGVIIYIFVTGKMPFDETKGTKSVVEEQRQLELKWLLHRRPCPSCQSLIRRSFTWDFADRPNAHVVLKDRWLTEKRPLPTSSGPYDSTSLPSSADSLTASVNISDHVTMIE